jgi:hypothetical protein
VYLHFLLPVSDLRRNYPNVLAYHLEGVELFLDLLGEHGCEPIAGGDIPTAIVLRAGPSIVELNPRAKANVPGTLRCTGKASCAGVW